MMKFVELIESLYWFDGGRYFIMKGEIVWGGCIIIGGMIWCFVV